MLSSKIKTILRDGLEPITEGKHNFETPNPDTEQLAESRATICQGCRYFKKEPISFFRVADAAIPILSGMSCGKCGCILSYKLRQSISPCKRWEKE